MAHRNTVKKWTYNGIKAYYPRLPYTEWLGICRRGDHLRKAAREVVEKVNWRAK
jgi:hypothetical protein